MRMLIRFLQGRWWRWMRGGSRFFFFRYGGDMRARCTMSPCLELAREAGRWACSAGGSWVTLAKGRECVSRKKTLASKPCWKHETIGTLAVGSSEKYPHQYMSAKKSISVSRLHLRILEDLTFFSTVGNSWCVVAGPQGESVDIWPVHLLGDVFSTRNRCSSVAMSIPKPSSCFTKDSCRRSSRRQTQPGGSRTFRGRYTSEEWAVRRWHGFCFFWYWGVSSTP